MAGTFDGLGVPAYGGYTCYNGTAPTTSYLTVNTIGTHDYVWADIGADNFISVTITDATTVTTGYIQAFYTSLSLSGGSADQMSAFAADISLGGTWSSEISGMYIYFGETGTALFGGTLAGVTINFPSYASATPPTTRSGIHVYSSEPDATVATLYDAALWAECSGSTGTFRSLLCSSGVTQPEYFLHIGTTAPENRLFCSDSISSMTGVASLRVNVEGTTYRIPLVADSCSG